MHLTMLLESHDRDLGFIAVGITSALGCIFFYQHYAYSLLHSLNYYHMICNPLQFDQYSKGVNILKRICFLLALSFLLSTASFVELVTMLMGKYIQLYKNINSFPGPAKISCDLSGRIAKHVPMRRVNPSNNGM